MPVKVKRHEEQVSWIRRRLRHSIRFVKSGTLSVDALVVSMTPNLYSVRNLSAVSHFIAAYPEVYPLLIELPMQIQRYLPDGRLELDVITDQEANEHSLLAKVLTDKSVEEVWGQFEQFRQEWWLGNIRRGGFKLLIDLG